MKRVFALVCLLLFVLAEASLPQPTYGA
jgi:hypothetical protein